MGLFDKLLNKKGQGDAVPELERIPPNPREPQASEFIEFTDEFGRVIKIPREKWKTELLPAVLTAHWEDPAALFADIVTALGNDFSTELLEAATHAKEIDTVAERGYTLLSMVLLKCQNFEQTQLLLEEYTAKFEKSSIILLHLAKAYAGTDQVDLAESTLWDAISINPNQNDSLAWWAGLQKTKGGDDAYIAALKKACTIENSWLPQLHLGNFYLAQKNLEGAMEQFIAVHTKYPKNEEALFIITGNLGFSGHMSEMISIAEPVYTINEFGPRVGLNLLNAYLFTKDYPKAEALLSSLLRLEQPATKEHLTRVAAQLYQQKSAAFPPKKIEQPPKLELFNLDKPIWFYGLKNPAWLLPSGEVTGKIGLLPYADLTKAENAPKRVTQEDDTGGMTRSIPLYLGESLQFHLNYRCSTIITFAKEYGATVSPKEYDSELMKNSAKKWQLDYLITGSIDRNDTCYTVKNTIYETDTDTFLTITKTIDTSNFGSEFIAMIEEIERELGGNRVSDTFYESPPASMVAQYLSALGQGLMQIMADSHLMPLDSVWGERNILNRYMNLALSQPSSQLAKMMLIAGLSKSKAFGSTVYLEYRKQLFGLIATIKEDNSVSKLLPLVLRLYDMNAEFDRMKPKILEAHFDGVYVAWLNHL